MAKVRYKEPSSGMKKMVVSKPDDSRPSLGLTEVKGEIFYLSTDLLIPYHNQSRKKFDQQALKDLAVSIQEQGILQPLLVIKSKSEDNKFEVVSGERRLRAAVSLNIQKVPCKILDQDCDADYIAIIENIQREDLHPIELGDAYAEIARIHPSLTQEEVAGKLGITRQNFQTYFHMSRMPADVKRYLIDKGVDNISRLRTLSSIKSEVDLRNIVFADKYKAGAKKTILRIYMDGDGFHVEGRAFRKLDVNNINQLKMKLKSLISELD